MIIDNVRIISPQTFPNEQYNEAEILGILLYLWYQNSKHQRVALDVSIDVLMPIIHSKNFAIFIVDGQPIGYFNWSYLTNENSQHYLKKSISYQEVVKNYSKPKINTNIWILTFFNTQKIHVMRYLGKKYIFNNKKVYFVYHKDNKKGTRNIITKYSY